MSSSPWPWVATTIIDRSPAPCSAALCSPAPAPVNSAGLTGSVRQSSARASSARGRVSGELPTITRCGTGNTASMYTSRAPSLWQEIGTTVIPSGMAVPNWSGLPSSSSRGSPSAMTCFASRITTGSAQAPPIQPSSSPSAVMSAREPCLLDEGPCRHTTVASANGWPLRASSLIRSSTPRPCIRPPRLVLANRGRAGHVAAVGERLPYPVGQHRHVDVPHPGAAERVHDRVDEGGGPAARGALADPLGADRVVRARRDDLAVQLVAGCLPGARQQVVHVVRTDAVAVGVERDELHA